TSSLGHDSLLLSLRTARAPSVASCCSMRSARPQDQPAVIALAADGFALHRQLNTRAEGGEETLRLRSESGRSCGPTSCELEGGTSEAPTPRGRQVRDVDSQTLTILDNRGRVLS